MAMYCFMGVVVSSVGNKKVDEGRRMGEWLRRLLVAMGPMYIKMGQILSTRSDILPEGAIRALQVLQDDVPPTAGRRIVAELEREYRRPLAEVFRDFDMTPLASASIAQVHRAVTIDGKQVAVKVVKPGVRRRMRANLRFFSAMTRLMHFLVPPVRHFRLPQRVAEVCRLLTEQLSMEKELDNLNAVAKNFKGHPFVTIPRAHADLSTDSVLVMELMEGIKATEFRRVGRTPKELARRLQDIIYTMLYMDGVCHGDPHPGNLLFTRDGNFIFLDFGIVARLTETEKWGLASFYYAATNHQWQLAARRFTKYFVVSDEDLMAKAAYVDDITRVLEHHFETVADRWSTAEFFKDVNKVLRKHGATYTTAFTKAELALVSCEGFATQMDPDIDIWENARRFSDQYSPFMSDEVKAHFDAHFAKAVPASMALRDRGKKSLVASTHLDRYFFPSAYPLFVADAQGARITDVDGNNYVDLSCGYGPHILGYGHPVAVEALRSAAARCNINALGHEAEVRLAELIVDAFPAADKAIFSNSGTEAVIHALRLCRVSRPRARRIAKFEGHYHGFSDQAMVSSWFRVTGDKADPEPIAGCQGAPQSVVDDTLVLQFGHPNSLEVLRRHADDVAGVLVEPMPPASGKINQAYLTELRGACTELGIPLVFDEVVTGFRVAYGGVQTITGIAPDLTCLGKIIGGGLPCGAVIGRRDMIDLGRTTGDPFRDYEERAFLGGTMSGNYLSCSAGIAVLEHLKANPKVYADLGAETQWLAGEMRQIAADHALQVRLKAIYSMFSLVFTHKETEFFREALQGANFKATLALGYWMRTHGVYMPEMHGYLISAAHNRDDFQVVLSAFDRSLGEMVKAGLFVN
jgi:glutamate-1-semialdehyde 2,1-aminomutase